MITSCFLLPNHLCCIQCSSHMKIDCNTSGDTRRSESEMSLTNWTSSGSTTLLLFESAHWDRKRLPLRALYESTSGEWRENKDEQRLHLYHAAFVQNLLIS